MTLRKITALAFLIAAMIGAPAYSSNVTVIAEGVFSQYTDPDGLLPFSEPATGTIFWLKFTYDDATPDSLDFVSGIGIYENAISDISLTIGSDTFGMGTSSNNILVFDDNEIADGDFADGWLAVTGTDTPTGIPNQLYRERFSVLLSSVLPSSPVPPLTSDALVEPSWPSGWTEGLIQYSIFLQTIDGSAPIETLASAKANVTRISVIPLPAAIWLFGSALSLFGWMRWKFT